MNRRLFLKATGSAVALAAMPLPVLNLRGWRKPAWIPVERVKVQSWPTTLVKYNKQITKPICTFTINGKKSFIKPGNYDPDTSCYIRQITIMTAAPNVKREDIIAEIEEKWNDDSALITTVGAEGAYLNMDKRTFRFHMTIGQLKKFLQNMRQREYEQHMEDYELTATKVAKTSRKWRKWYDEKYSYLHVIPYGPNSIVKERFTKNPRYSYKAFAREMISSRDQVLKDFNFKSRSGYRPEPEVYPSLAAYHGVS